MNQTTDRVETGLDGTPRQESDPTTLAASTAMEFLEEARKLVREAMCGLHGNGLHHAAEHCTVIIDSIDDLRTSLVGGAS